MRDLISSIKVGSQIDDTDTIDLDEFSHKNESAEMNNLLSVQLEKAQNEKLKLKAIDFRSKNKVEAGAVVKTDQFCFVVGVATPPFKVDGDQYLGISIDAPIFSEMKEKKIGETFSYANNKYTIISVN